MNKKYKNLLKDGLIFALGGIGSKMILFFLVPLYTNFLTTEEYGVADLVFTVSQLLIPIISLSVYNGVLRFSLANNEKKEDVFICGLFIFLIGAIASVCLTPLISFYKAIQQWKWYLSIYVILNILLDIELNYIKAKGNNKLYAIMSVTQTLIMASLNILMLAIFHKGIQGYLLASIFACVVSVIGIFIFGKLWRDMRIGKVSFALLKRMLKYSIPLILNNLSWWVIHSSDKIMMEFMIGASFLGLYTVATKIPSLINVFISIFQQAWGISAIKEVEGTQDNTFYSNVFNVFSFVAFAISICLICVIKPFMTIYVGDSFLSAWKYVPLLLASATFSAISSYFGSMYSALKKSNNAMLTTLLAAIINISLNFLFIPRIGVWGAIVGTIVAYFCVAVIRLIDVLRYIKINICWWRLILNCAILLIQSVLVSFNIAIYVTSVICLLIFAIINVKTIKLILLKGKKKGSNI